MSGGTTLGVAFDLLAMEADSVWTHPTLAPGLAATRRLRLVDGAEPARAFADLHLDLRIPAAGRLVIDAHAGAVDVALDGAIGRGATGPDAEASKIRRAVGGGLTAPRIAVVLLRTRQSQGAMNAPAHMPILASRAAF